MTIEQKGEAIRKHCKTKPACGDCKLRNTVGGCYTGGLSDSEIEENYNLLFGKPEAERGDNSMENNTITISLERYEELIRKEAMYDKITEGKDVELYLMTRKESKNYA